MKEKVNNFYSLITIRYPRLSRGAHFLVAGGIGACVNVTILFLFTDVFKVWYIASAVIAFVFSFIVSFFLQKFFTFKDGSMDRIHRQAGSYLLIGLLNLCVNTLLMYFFVEYVGFHHLLSQIVVSALIAIESYFLYALVFGTLKARTVNISDWAHHAAFFAVLFTLAAGSIVFLDMNMRNDSSTYLEAITALHGQLPPDFVPNRLITSLGAVELLVFFSALLGSVTNGWIFMNLCFFFIVSGAFYILLLRAFRSKKTAFLGGIFLAGNYAMLVFGINYLVDIGGWTFYLLSILFLFFYSETKEKKYLLSSALAVGIGGLFKEYAFLGAFAIAAYLLIENRRSLKDIFMLGFQTALIALLPVIFVCIFVYTRFQYTYADWFAFNSNAYVYDSRIIEYIKAFGSLLNLIALCFIPGFIILCLNWKSSEERMRTFIAAFAVSFLPVFFWPAITQRILFTSMPFCIFVSCFFFKKAESKWYLILLLWIPYVLASFLMDSFILKAVNLPF